MDRGNGNFLNSDYFQVSDVSDSNQAEVDHGSCWPPMLGATMAWLMSFAPSLLIIVRHVDFDLLKQLKLSFTSVLLWVVFRGVQVVVYYEIIIFAAAGS